MSSGHTPYITVPTIGPLELGGVYRRSQLNDRFGGNRMSGIVPSKKEPVVLLFHTEEPSQQFYQDGFDANGLYWYSGEGAKGDMEWTAANKAVRDHMAERRDLMLFERVQRKDGLWRFASLMRYFDHQLQDRADREGNLREAIVFALLTDSASRPEYIPTTFSLAESKRAISELSDSQGLKLAEQIKRIFRRSAFVAAYAKARADGICEACLRPAPFSTKSGEPFLEVHHIDRLADGGADRCDQVAAICPNCHRRCHYGLDGEEYNSKIRARNR